MFRPAIGRSFQIKINSKALFKQNYSVSLDKSVNSLSIAQNNGHFLFKSNSSHDLASMDLAMYERAWNGFFLPHLRQSDIQIFENLYS